MPSKNNKLIIEFHYTYLIMALGFILTGYFINLIVFTSIIIFHELGHYLTAKLFKFKVSKIIIYPYGGLTKIDDIIDKDINKELIVASSGIIIQYIYYLIITYLNNINYIRDYTYNLFTLYNTQIIFFNLLIIIPLDGYKIINLLLNKLFYYKLSQAISIIISIINIIIIISLDIYSYNYSNIMILSIFIWYIYYFCKNYKYIYKRFQLEKYLYPNNYNKIKTINNTNKMYRNRKHLLYGNIEEKKFLNKLFLN